MGRKSKTIWYPGVIKKIQVAKTNITLYRKKNDEKDFSVYSEYNKANSYEVTYKSNLEEYNFFKELCEKEKAYKINSSPIRTNYKISLNPLWKGCIISIIE